MLGKMPGRKYSLKREWSRVFFVMLFLLLLAAGTTIAGMQIVVGELRNSAAHLQVQTDTIATLRAAIVSHEEIAHKLLSDETIDRPQFLRQQRHIIGLFDAAAHLYPPDNAGYLAFTQARYSWQYGLTFAGLWGNSVYLMRGNHSVENPIYGASSDGTVALLDSLSQPTLAQLNRGVARGRDLEMILLVVLVVLFVAALSVTEFSRRRMINNLLDPLGTLHESAMRLEAGDYEHRVIVTRNDEIGDLDIAFNDMADAMRSNQRSLEHRATHDMLTGLPNRALLVDRLATSFGPGPDRRSPRVSVLFIDIDDFKDVNDRLGHHGGDELLIDFAERLSRCVRPVDLVGRLGGDEFAVIVSEDHDGLIATEVAKRILDETRVPFDVSGTDISVTVSIGIAMQQVGIVDSMELLRDADLAMYQAKREGKDRLEVFEARDASTSQTNPET